MSGGSREPASWLTRHLRDGAYGVTRSEELHGTSVSRNIGTMDSPAITVKQLTDYLDRAIALERMAADEPDSTFKSQLMNQAAAYRKLAARKANDHGLPAPSPPNSGL